MTLRAPLLGGLLACLSACAVGPDFKRPAAPEASDYGSASPPAQTRSAPIHWGEAQHFASASDVPTQWWALYGSAPLNALVEQSLKDNPDLASARAALRQAHELYRAQQASLFPTVQASFAGQRARNPVESIANPTSLPQQDAYYNLYTAQLSVSYVPDVFGGVRRGVEAAKAQADAARFQLAATYLTLTTNVVVTAITEAGLRAQIDATRRILTLQHQVSERMSRQEAIGSVSRLDLISQQALEAQAAATLPPLEKQLGQARDALSALAGKLPSQEPGQTFTLEGLSLPADLPIVLPSRLVELRPDVRAAEENLHFASAQAGVATANLLPQFLINGTLGSTSLAIGDLFRTGTGFWDLGASISQTVLDAGALIHRRRAAYAALDQAGMQYRSAVILACQNVADTLRALKADADALGANEQAATLAQQTLQLAQHQLDLGSISVVQLMNSEQAYQQAQLALIQTQTNRATDTAALFQALGGDWRTQAQLNTP